MRLLIFSDLHAHAFRPYSEILPNGRNSRLNDTLNVMEEIYQLCKTENIEGVLCGGDLFHARSILNVATFNDVYEAVAKIRNIVSFFVLVVGNHDQSNKLGTIHSTKTFNAVVDVIDTPKWYTGKTVTEAIHIFGVPFTGEKDKIIEAISTGVNEYPDGAPALLLGHFGVSGANPGANFVLKTADLPTLPDLKPDLFQQVFLGHYHMHQELLSNVQFVGAPLQHNWGDAGQARGVCLYDTATNLCRMVDLRFAPKFLRFKFSEIHHTRQLTNNIVRVVFDNYLTRDDWADLKKRILQAGARWAEEWIEFSESKSEKTESPYTPNMDLEDMIDPYVDATAGTDLDPAVLKELGHEFIRSCR